MKERASFEERSGWPWWVHSLISICFLAALAPVYELLTGDAGSGEGAMHPAVILLCLALGFGIPGLLYALFGQLRVRVLREGLQLAWGYSEIIRKFIPYGEVQGAEAVTYSPLGEFGGWGIRMGKGRKLAWTIQGKRALVLHLKSGTHFYLGSTHPERLLLRVEAAQRGKGSTDRNDEERNDE